MTKKELAGDVSENFKDINKATAEEVVDFKRGFVCDMECSFQLVEVNVSENNVVNERIDIIKDLVLVYINKDTQYGYVPDFEYVFYK